MWNGNSAASVLPGHSRPGGFSHHVSRLLRYRNISLGASQYLLSESPLLLSRWSLTQVQAKYMSFGLGPGKTGLGDKRVNKTKEARCRKWGGDSGAFFFVGRSPELKGQMPLTGFFLCCQGN